MRQSTGHRRFLEELARLVERERRPQDVVHVPDRHQVHGLEHALGDVAQVLGVVLGEDHGRDAAAVGGQDLLLEPADGQHAAAQGDLAGHGHVAADLGAQQGRHHAGADGDAGRGPVLGNRALGQVHVDVGARVEVAVDAERRRPRADVADGGLGGLLHDVAELAGKHQLALARHDGHLGDQEIAAVRGHGQAVGHADLVGRLLLAHAVAGRPQVLDQALGRDLPGRHAPVGQVLARDLAADRGDLALEAAHAGLLGVALDEGAQGFFGQADVQLAEAVLALLLGDEVLTGDGQLLELGVARRCARSPCDPAAARECPACSSRW